MCITQEAFTTAYNCMGASRAGVGSSMIEGVGRASEASGLVGVSHETATQSQALVRLLLPPCVDGSAFTAAGPLRDSMQSEHPICGHSPAQPSQV